MTDRYNIKLMTSKKDVVYYFDEMIGTYHYAFAHPMKPLRVAMTDEIVRKYDLDKHFDTVVPMPSLRTSSSQSCTTTMPVRSTSPPSTPMNTSISSRLSLPRTALTLRTSSIASTSKRTVPSWRGFTTTASATPPDP